MTQKKLSGDWRRFDTHHNDSMDQRPLGEEVYGARSGGRLEVIKIPRGELLAKRCFVFCTQTTTIPIPTSRAGGATSTK